VTATAVLPGGSPGPADDPELRWRTTAVQGRRAQYGIGGTGLPVVFLHGWGLGHRAYRSALRELMVCGCRVYAPSLPGFGGTADLPRGQRTIEGYATWVDAFLDTVGLIEPALVVGHSFGGGVATRLAFDRPQRVRYLVLVNSVGGGFRWTSSGRGVRQQSGVPAWASGFGLVRELMSGPDGYRVVEAMSADALGNLIRNPVALAEIGLLARFADLTAELAELGRRELPVLVLTSGDDGVIPLASFDALCAAIGTERTVLDGGHSWLLARPSAFAEVLENIVQIHADEDEAVGLTTTAEQLRRLLRHTTVPARSVKALVRGAAPLWLMSEPPAALAGDLALCHPPLAGGEVRAVARPSADAAVHRLTVVAADRPGLLADTAAAVAAEGLSVRSASAATWDDLALHAMTIRARGSVDWDALGERLRREVNGSERAAVRPRFRPTGPARVQLTGVAPGRSIVKVTAPDGLGLLESVARWLSDHGVSIEAARITTRAGTAVDTFLVRGAIDAGELANALSPARRRARSCPLGWWLHTR